jgi:hypothetical protein
VSEAELKEKKKAQTVKAVKNIKSVSLFAN